MKKIITTLICFCSLAISVFGQKTDKPNIILIVADDLGYGDLSSYGQKKFKTPNIDRLAARGMRFTQFYSGTSVCAPSRSSLMSGQHTGHTYIRGNKEVYPEGQQPIPDSVHTIAEVLKSTGYTTAAFGKWGLGFVGTEGDPLNQGFDSFYGYNCQRESHRYYPGHLWDNRTRVIINGKDDLKTKAVYAPGLIQEKALSFIEEHKDEPFFLFLPYTLPHAELEVPKDNIFARFDGKFPETPFKGDDYGESATPIGYTSQDKPHATFAAMVTRLDIYVGQVMSTLKRLKLDQNTLVIFTSDNGPHKEGGADPEFFNSSGGFRGTKRDLYEGGIRVPFIASWPGKIKAGSTSSFTGAFWDIYPTLTQLSGTAGSKNIDGISILPELLGTTEQQQHEYLYWEFHELGGRQAVRQGNWKAVYLNVKDPAKRALELYDLSKDPQEKNNIAKQHPEVSSRMLKIIDSAHTESRIFPLIP
ncbi:arylsulfatase [Daejeonella sp. JGW-45]|uniref:arylsulfatase n=1 Tax=Daejeonella sp. JGW-45 TaxID=3034148 RepID=UPI0023EDE702|nr:arylsulfatase [Daejeonella sp. JGW-45]